MFILNKSQFFLHSDWWLSFGLVWFYGISKIVGYLMPKPVSTYIYIRYIWFGLVWFYGISTLIGYLIPKHVSTYTLNIFDLVWLGFMAYQPFEFIKCQILFKHICHSHSINITIISSTSFKNYEKNTASGCKYITSGSPLVARPLRMSTLLDLKT